MKSEMQIQVNRVTVSRKTGGNITVRVNADDTNLARLMEITPEESENLQRALEMLTMITRIA